MTTLADTLAARTREGTLVERRDGGALHCVACAHECPVADGAAGVCRVRFNRGGHLMVPWGYVSGACADPIEKKPFFHVVPGSRAFSFGMLGCDLHCAFCQNWLTSQALRDPLAGAGVTSVAPADLVAAALRTGSASVVSTYNEPLITAEWGAAIFDAARAQGLMTGLVSNGHATPQVLDFLGPRVDLFKVDLKSFDERQYRKLGGRLQPVLDTIAALHARGIWVEVVTLLVPGLNDSDDELRQLTGFVRDVSPDIPWHVTAFHADYHMDDRPATSPAAIVRAAGLGRENGLRFVYAGNLPGHVGRLEDTRCPGCGLTLVERSGYRLGAMRVTAEGACPQCQRPVPGRWSQARS